MQPLKLNVRSGTTNSINILKSISRYNPAQLERMQDSLPREHKEEKEVNIYGKPVRHSPRRHNSPLLPRPTPLHTKQHVNGGMW